jgi:sulfate permease, SulP family
MPGPRRPLRGPLPPSGWRLAALFLTPLIAFLPKATLAATIIVAVLSLVDLSILKRTWDYSRADFAAVAGTMAVTLGVGRGGGGFRAGVLLSLLLHLYRTSRPHVAEVGAGPGDRAFPQYPPLHRGRRTRRCVTLRVDESLYFANTRYLEDLVLARVSGDTNLKHVILMCSAVNEIDLSALETLETLDPPPARHGRDAASVRGEGPGDGPPAPRCLA